MLVDHPDPRPYRIGRRTEGLRLAVDRDGAFIRLVQPIKLAHQGALTRSVFTEQCMDFSGTDIEAYPGVGQNAWKAFVDIAHFDMLDALDWDGIGFRGHGSPELSFINQESDFWEISSPDPRSGEEMAKTYS
jgi:hypothetical protein